MTILYLSGGANADPALSLVVSSILLESGYFLLLESVDKLLLEA